MYLLGKGAYDFSSVGLPIFLSVCLFVCSTLLKKLQITMKFYGGIRGGKRHKWLDLVVIQITMLAAQSEIWPILNKLWMDFDEIFRIAL